MILAITWYFARIISKFFLCDFYIFTPNNLEFLEFRIPYENTARNSKIPKI